MNLIPNFLICLKYVKNHRKVVSDFAGKNYSSFDPPPVITLTSKCHNFFSLNNHNTFQFKALGAVRLCKSISNPQTFHFFRNVFSLSVSHQYAQFYGENTTIFEKRVENRQTPKKNWETDKAKAFVYQTFSISTEVK